MVTKVSYECLQCGKVFDRPPSFIRTGKPFCSRKCSVRSRFPGNYTYECTHCKRLFSSRPSLKAGRNNVFCSLQCSHEYAHIQALITFWDNVNKTDGCWEWQKSRSPTGYGHISIGKEGHAHRMAWMLAYGPIPPGMWVLHKCDNPPCCRPDHLFLGTAKDNAADRDMKGRNGVQDKGNLSLNRKLTATQVIFIQKLRADGWTYPFIAMFVPVGISSLKNVVAGRTYATNSDRY